MSPQQFSLKSLARSNIWNLKPYRCARDDFSEGILLDANENALGPAIADDAATTSSPQSTYRDDIARYPDPHQQPLKDKIRAFRNLSSPDQVFLGVGSDEVIDLLMRIFCVPAKDSILITPPTYGMYSVSADINDVGVVKVPLTMDGRFQLDVEPVLAALADRADIKLVFLCSPGNPTGSQLALADVRRVLDYDRWHGVVVVDEAYVDFCSREPSAATLLADYPNLVVSQTMSKSFGLAGLRLGTALGHPDLIALMSKTKAPYNISTPTSEIGLRAFEPASLQVFCAHIETIKAQRQRLLSALTPSAHRRVGRVVGTNDANFVLVEICNRDGAPDNAVATQVYKQLANAADVQAIEGSEPVVVRYRGNEPGCTGCLRVTVGTDAENSTLLSKLWTVLDRLDI
ncbi:histidinol-phosphate transaminase [Sorochytrium milnesiophthora]